MRTAKLSARTVVVDIGRVSKASASTAAEADLVMLVVRPDLVSVLGAERALRCLEAAAVSRERVVAIVKAALSSPTRRHFPGNRPAETPVVGDFPGNQAGEARAG